MYFINIKKLKQEIKEDRFTEKRSYPYFFWTFLLFMVMITPTLSGGYPELNAYDHLSSLVVVIATIIGLKYSYHTNGGDNGHDFIKKFFAISWVQGWRVIIPTTIIFLIILLVTRVYENGLMTSALTVVYDIISYGLIYYFVGEDLKELNKKHH